MKKNYSTPASNQNVNTLCESIASCLEALKQGERQEAGWKAIYEIALSITNFVFNTNPGIVSSACDYWGADRRGTAETIATDVAMKLYESPEKMEKFSKATDDEVKRWIYSFAKGYTFHALKKAQRLVWGQVAEHLSVECEEGNILDEQSQLLDKLILQLPDKQKMVMQKKFHPDNINKSQKELASECAMKQMAFNKCVHDASANLLKLAHQEEGLRLCA